MEISEEQCETLLNYLEVYNVASIKVVTDALDNKNLQINFRGHLIPFFIDLRMLQLESNPIFTIVELFESIIEYHPDYKSAMMLKEGVQWLMGKED